MEDIDEDELLDIHSSHWMEYEDRYILKRHTMNKSKEKTDIKKQKQSSQPDRQDEKKNKKMIQTAPTCYEETNSGQPKNDT